MIELKRIPRAHQLDLIKKYNIEKYSHVVTLSKKINSFDNEFVVINTKDKLNKICFKHNISFNSKNITRMMKLTEIAETVFEYASNKFIYLVRSKYRLFDVNGTKIFSNGNNVKGIGDANISLLEHIVYDLHVYGIPGKHMFCPDIDYIENPETLPITKEELFNYYKD